MLEMDIVDFVALYGEIDYILDEYSLRAISVALSGNANLKKGALEDIGRAFQNDRVQAREAYARRVKGEQENKRIFEMLKKVNGT